MTSSHPVYQATTVTYEQQSTFPLQYFGITVSQARCVQWILLLGGSFTLAAGIVMAIVGAVATQYEDAALSGSSGGIVAAVGTLMIVLGMCMLIGYFKIIRRRNICPCCPVKPIRLVRQPTKESSNRQEINAPSNQDGILTMSYTPVPEVAFQQRTMEGEEHAKLMSSESKDCHDDSERMLDDDPRIVLRPLRQVDEY